LSIFFIFRFLTGHVTLFLFNCILCSYIFMSTIVIKPGLRVNPTKGPGPGLHGLTWVNLEKLKINI
jgi:hypothetical protein